MNALINGIAKHVSILIVNYRHIILNVNSIDQLSQLRILANEVYAVELSQVDVSTIGGDTSTVETFFL